jgi:hypothetical protein
MCDCCFSFLLFIGTSGKGVRTFSAIPFSTTPHMTNDFDKVTSKRGKDVPCKTRDERTCDSPEWPFSSRYVCHQLEASGGVPGGVAFGSLVEYLAVSGLSVGSERTVSQAAFPELQIVSRFGHWCQTGTKQVSRHDHDLTSLP